MKEMFKDLGLGLSSFRDAHNFIIKEKFWLYLLIPGAINLILFIVSLSYFLDGSAFLTDWTLSLLNLDVVEEGFKGILKEVLYWTIFIVMRLLFILFYMGIYKYIVLIILAPVLAWVSEKAEERINGKEYPFDFAQFAKDIIRGVMIALRNLAIEMAFFVALWIASMIPVVGLIAPVIMFGIQSYFYGFSMMDYYNERRRMNVKDSIKFIYKHKGIAIANGAVFYGLFLLPVVGWIISPIYSVIAATIALEKRNPSNQITINS